ncbi:DUF3237 family protein [Arsenicicoccus sp. MKL-02]|uniref:DUF3237 family protein n=2 Tax=Arsenicicoccus TaxID=267408 RepID=A0A6I3IGC8_9MICO|nr:DUF3237 family protein [Arsenicicoccus cauae]
MRGPPSPGRPPRVARRPSPDIAALVRGEVVPFDRIYFRCTPRLPSSGPRWGWLAGPILLGTGRRTPDAVHLDVFVVD